MEKRVWESKIYDIREGICAFISEPGIAKSNCGMICGERYGIYIDAMGNGAITHEFQEEAEKRAKVPVQHVIFTHSHGDHTFGAHGYHGVRSIATKKTKIEFDNDLDSPSGPILKKSLVYREGDSFRSPIDIVFENRLDLDLGGRTVQVIDFGHCHTTSDSIIYCPEEKIAFCGDILFNQIGFMGMYPNVENWIHALDVLIEMDIETYIGGHGPIADKQDVRECREFLTLIYEAAKEGHANRVSPIDVAEDIELGKFEAWHENERVILLLEPLYRALDGETLYPLKAPRFNPHEVRIRFEKEGRRATRNKKE